MQVESGWKRFGETWNCEWEKWVQEWVDHNYLIYLFLRAHTLWVVWLCTFVRASRLCTCLLSIIDRDLTWCDLWSWYHVKWPDDRDFTWSDLCWWFHMKWPLLAISHEVTFAGDFTWSNLCWRFHMKWHLLAISHEATFDRSLGCCEVTRIA